MASIAPSKTRLDHSAGRALDPLKGLDGSAIKKSAILKADRNSAISAELDNFAYFTLQRHFGLPGERIGDQPDPISNFEIGLHKRALLHTFFALNLSSARPCHGSDLMLLHP